MGRSKTARRDAPRLGMAARINARIKSALPSRDEWFSTLAAAWFKADIIAAADPLSPDASVIANGIREAAILCAHENRPVRLLVARVPGTTCEISFSSVRRIVETVLTQLDSSTRVAAKTATAELPQFSFGAKAAVFTLDGAGDNLRLIFEPSETAFGKSMKIRRA